MMVVFFIIGREYKILMNTKRDPEIIKYLSKSFKDKGDTLVVIPARSGSKRFIDKNIYPIDGLPMMIRASNAALNMSAKPRVIISVDTLRYASICEEHNVEHLIRKPYLGCDSAPKQAVIVDTCLNLYENEGYLPNYVISLQANSPDITTSILNKIFAHHTSIGDEVYRETVTINENGDQNGAVRIMNIATVFQNSLSTYLTTFKINLRDVHLKSDV